MYDVGSDRLALLPAGIGPAAPAHAVDRDGEVLCREERPRYHFPWLDWMGELTPDEARAAACPDCAAIALERALPAAALDDPYPSAATSSAPYPNAPYASAAYANAAPAVTATVVEPSQPAIDWLRFPQDFSIWSDGL